MEKASVKQIILNCEKLETRVAFLHNGKLEEYEIERPQDGASVGSLYLGKIVNLENSLQAAFVDIGAEKNAFLHYWDMLPASYEMADQIIREKNEQKEKKRSSFSEKIRRFLGQRPSVAREIEKTRKLRKKLTINNIPSLFPAGSELLIQVTKGPIGTKGARVTTNLTLPGRYLVLLPYSDHIGLSSKIEDRKERERLKKILLELDLPEGMGLICRTVGEGRKSIYFKRDLEMLLDYWQRVEEKLENPKPPMVVYQEPSLLERTVRDFLTEDIDEIIVDNDQAAAELKRLLSRFLSKSMSGRITLHNKALPVFDHYGVTAQIDNIFKREVPLASGGYICIDETEALIAIDVNTGKGRMRGKEQPEAILQTNLEAAEEVARQLRLRNIGGLVVIDFIDMRPAGDREAVYKHMIKNVKDDKAKSKILQISKLGLMEMTRQREHESLKDALFTPCPYCNGSGRIKSVLTMSVEIQRRLNEILKRYRSNKTLAVRVIIHPAVLARLKNEDAFILMELEEKYGKNLSFRAEEHIHQEEFRLIDPETNVEY